MKWKNLDIVAFDTETTGLDPFAGDRVIEVALVVFRLDEEGAVAGQRVVSHLVNPGIPVPRKVTEITGIRDEDLAGKPPFAVIAEEVAELLSGSVGVAHNVPFDHAFLVREFLLAGVPWREPIATIDTVDVSMKHFPTAKGHKLSDVSRRLGVELVDAHRAHADAEACGRSFIELARKHAVPDELQALLDWADAVGRPPDDGALDVDPFGLPVFTEGPFAGEPVQDHPLHLSWMTLAKVEERGTWRFRYPESTRRWARRFLDVRAAGRARGAPKSFRESDWALDPCIADRRAPAA
ncbi:MAG: 3'-5' exonuclease [Alphaproteobacteria bacterium]|nr:3'-5' exonuclease [Alphaproteobacteria bacterium]